MYIVVQGSAVGLLLVSKPNGLLNALLNARRLSIVGLPVNQSNYGHV